METVVDWLREHPEAKVDAAELFGCSSQEAPDLVLNDIYRVVPLVEALSNRAAACGAPVVVQDQFVELVQEFRDGISAIDRRGSYTQKTLASLVGLRDLRDVKMVLRGAFPHAPTEADRDTIVKLDKTLAEDDPGIKSGGSIIWCLIGCVICEPACIVCCTILFETNTPPVSPPQIV